MYTVSRSLWCEVRAPTFVRILCRTRSSNNICPHGLALLTGFGFHHEVLASFLKHSAHLLVLHNNKNPLLAFCSTKKNCYFKSCDVCHFNSIKPCHYRKYPSNGTRRIFYWNEGDQANAPTVASWSACAVPCAVPFSFFARAALQMLVFTSDFDKSIYL